MAHVKYTRDHEYIRIENGIGTVGITNHAQEKLGDVTYVELPAVGKVVNQSDPVGVVESVKAASDVYTPVSGEIMEVNEALNDKPELVNEDAENAAWFFKIRLAHPAELNHLLERDAYISFAEGEV
jgi:glycine cleavage system H protein